MLKAVAFILAAAAVGIAPAATPFVIGTFQPQPVSEPAGASRLPEIGRTRSVRPACAALRDLVAPSFAAAKRADQRFAESRKRLPNYADMSDDPDHANDALRQYALVKLDADVSVLLEEAKVLGDALGDPRISAYVKDPEVVAERRALQQLYDAQMTRASLLNEFVMRQKVATAKFGTGENSGFTRATPPPATNPLPEVTAPPGMPRLTGNFLIDRNTFEDWGSALTTFVRTYEGYASKTVLPIVRNC